MFKQILTTALIAASILGLGGCGAGKLEVKPLPKLAQKTVEFNFLKVDPLTGEKIEFNPQIFNLAGEIVKLSKYGEFRVPRQKRSKIIDYRGLKIEKDLNKYKLSYSNGHLNNNTYYLNEVMFDIHVNKKSDNSLIFTSPSTRTYQPCSNALGISIDPLDSLPTIEADMKRVFNSLDSMVVTFSRKYKLKGDVNSPYPATAIYANFKRMSGEYNWQGNEEMSESKKSNVFNLKVNSKDIPLFIEVFPYREGSKVQYSTMVPYTLNSKSEVSLTKEDIQALKASIAKIIND